MLRIPALMRNEVALGLVGLAVLLIVYPGVIVGSGLIWIKVARRARWQFQLPVAWWLAPPPTGGPPLPPPGPAGPWGQQRSLPASPWPAPQGPPPQGRLPQPQGEPAPQGQPSQGQRPQPPQPAQQENPVPPHAWAPPARSGRHL